MYLGDYIRDFPLLLVQHDMTKYKRCECRLTNVLAVIPQYLKGRDVMLAKIPVTL